MSCNLYICLIKLKKKRTNPSNSDVTANFVIIIHNSDHYRSISKYREIKTHGQLFFQNGKLGIIQEWRGSVHYYKSHSRSLQIDHYQQ